MYKKNWITIISEIQNTSLEVKIWQKKDAYPFLSAQDWEQYLSGRMNSDEGAVLPQAMQVDVWSPKFTSRK